MATQLQQQGEETALLTMLDAYPWTENQETALTEQAHLASILILAGCPAPSKDDRAMLIRAGVVESLRHSDNPMTAELDDAQLSALITNYINNAQLGVHYRSTSTYHGDMLHFTATHGQTENAPTAEAWKPYISGTIDTHDIGCIHMRMTEPAPLAHIGQLLATKLDTLSTSHTTSIRTTTTNVMAPK
jgi:thioesterase domain-containing protein